MGKSWEESWGKAPDENLLQNIIACVKEHPQVAGIYDLMIHDYGFGYFVISMHITGRKEHCERLNRVAEEAAFSPIQKYHCDTFIQVDYLIEDEALAEKPKQSSIRRCRNTETDWPWIISG